MIEVSRLTYVSLETEQRDHTMGDELNDKSNESQDFSSMADEQELGLVAEFWDFLIHNKKWWLTPIVLVLLLMGVLVMLSGTAAAPFIYTLW